jgi:large subunit ribosomal protein L1
MAPRGKKYKEAAEKIDILKEYSPSEAIALVKETSYAKFDSTVELHLRLGVDPRHAEQQVRDVTLLPHGLGKEVRVLVFAQGDGAKMARDAGVTEVADDKAVLKKIEEGWLDFDVAISTPDMMGTVGKLGRVLGPRGLMPNPKAGTVVPEKDLPRAIEEAKAGRVEFRLDKTANIHVSIGKVSFEDKMLFENMAVLMHAIKKARPAAAKGAYLRSVTLTSTMSPPVRVDVQGAQEMELAN